VAILGHYLRRIQKNCGRVNLAGSLPAQAIWHENFAFHSVGDPEQGAPSKVSNRFPGFTGGWPRRGDCFTGLAGCSMGEDCPLKVHALGPVAGNYGFTHGLFRG